MSKIKIGADELILWLRKNEKVQGIPNDQIDGLGIIIYNLIVKKLGGKKVADNYPSHWDFDDKSVDQFNLPKTSAQYEIESEKIGHIYEFLFTKY